MNDKNQSQDWINDVDISTEVKNQKKRSIIDPEFKKVDNNYLMAYYGQGIEQTMNGIYVVGINLDNGDLKDEPHLMACQNPTPFIRAIIQGPEWACSSQGPSILYSINNHGKYGTVQIARSFLSEMVQEGQPVPKPQIFQLSPTVMDYGKVIPIATWNSMLDHLKICYFTMNAEKWHWQWFQDNTQIRNEIQTAVNVYTQPPRWMADGKNLVFSCRNPQTHWSAQIAKFDCSATIGSTIDQLTILTTDENTNKLDPDFIENAPDYSGKTIFYCVVRENTIEEKIYIYLDDLKDSPLLQKINELTIPIDAQKQGYKMISSVEALRAGKRSFLIVRLQNLTNLHDASIWLWSVDGTIQRRVDGGALNGLPMSRYDPEGLIGNSQIYVYYTSIKPVSSENPTTTKNESSDGEKIEYGLQRCHTGIDPDGNIIA